jgi:hypothetical protein
MILHKRKTPVTVWFWAAHPMTTDNQESRNIYRRIPIGNAKFWASDGGLGNYSDLGGWPSATAGKNNPLEKSGP